MHVMSSPLPHLVLFFCLSLLSAAAATSARQISWSGYTWNVKDTGDERMDPDGNFWDGSDRSVFVTADGELHLRILYDNGKKRWTCSEIFMDQGSLGYGTYRFLVRSPTGAYDPNLVVGLFTYGQPLPLENGKLKFNEIDIEFSRFRNLSSPTEGKYTVQPAFRAPRTSFRNAPGQTTIHEFKWKPRRVDFKSYWGPLDNPWQWQRLFSYSSKLSPTPSNDRVHINFWLSHGYRTGPINNLPAEFVLSKFYFIK